MRRFSISCAGEADLSTGTSAYPLGLQARRPFVRARCKPRYEDRSDLELAADIARRDAAAMRLVMQRNNQRLLRTAWRILKNRADAEDAVQSAYLKAFAAIGSFAGRSSLSTWLIRIVTNDALAAARAMRRRRSWLEGSPASDLYGEKLMRGSMSPSPDQTVARMQIRQSLQDAIDRLPVSFRTVFVLRQIEELNVGEVAETLGIPAATVKTRHLRARRRLQQVLGTGLTSTLSDLFPFAGAACGRPTT